MNTVKKLTLKGDGIPAILRQIPDPPKILFVMGDLPSLLENPRLAVIGSRKVSPYGKAVTASLTEAVARQGVVIVSGLALGVDGLAHQAALNAPGRTIAVLPSGLDQVYPSTHYHLAQRILKQGGALITEYPEGSEPYKLNFIARNRLVSGLSDGVLITEAAAKSGTMHTASFALDQGKAVMAVPGNITSPLSEGTNNLIKSGASPVTTPQDIFAALKIEVSKEQLEIVADNEAEYIILSLLKNGLTDSSELQARSQLKPAVFNQTLTMLEITNRIKPLGANHWALK